MEFLDAFKIQEYLMNDIKYKNDDHLIFVEHPSIYTMGRRYYKDMDQYINKKYLNDIDLKNNILKINRGGNITFHGNGQLVIYPIFDLKKSHFKKDLYWFLRKIEEIIIDLLLNEYNLKTKYNFDCFHDEQYTGVWIKDNNNNNNNNIEYKISAIGIGVTKWKTYHGISFNINTDLNYFDKIIPCGIYQQNKSVINLMDIINDDMDKSLCTQQEFNQFTTNMINKLILLFEKHFNIKCQEKKYKFKNIIIT